MYDGDPAEGAEEAEGEAAEVSGLDSETETEAEAETEVDGEAADSESVNGDGRR